MYKEYTQQERFHRDGQVFLSATPDCQADIATRKPMTVQRGPSSVAAVIMMKSAASIRVCFWL
ncbi:hypothetical protein QE396_004747 [Enterobacter sp. SORGH_AS 287]|nr:hypothetical protein [Enterobacter sp. SORGH_AS_0287]